jgi:hypothetical protein
MSYFRPLGDLIPGLPGEQDSQYSLSDFIGQILNTASGLDVAAPEDVPTASGTGSISSADFTASASGVCNASNVTALNYVKSLQKQLNRVAAKKGLGTITADGEVGPATLALFTKVQGLAGTAIMGTPSAGCMGVAPDADVLTDQVKAYADSIGAPAVASGALGVSRNTLITKTGQQKSAAGLFDVFNGMGTLEKLAVVGVVGGIGYMLFTGKKKGGTPARKTSRRY